MDRTQIERFASGTGDFERAVRGLTPAQFDARPIPGTWTIREITAHLYDSDMVGCDRMRRVIAMDTPLLMGYDQDRYVARLDYARVDPAAAVAAFTANRLLLAPVLRAQPDEAFGRAGVHSERGRETLAHMVKGYCDHLDHHLSHLFQKREMLTGRTT
ncbi:MAG: DinB family protein [Phycisphaerales bacterium]|nr:DinB family protein [Phycisphaerales bacterium]